jgi:hypothetical protein
MAGWLGWLKGKPRGDGAKAAAPTSVLDEHALELERGRFERLVALLASSGVSMPDAGQPRTLDELRAARLELAALDARAAGLEAAAEAERVIGELGDPLRRASLLVQLCDVCATAGDTASVRRLLGELTTLFREGDFDPSSLAHSLRSAAGRDRSDTERALGAEITACVAQLIDGCTDPARRIAALCELVSARALAGDFEGAREWLARIDDSYWDSDARTGLAEAQCQAGDIQGALATAEPIRDAAMRDRVSKALATAWAHAGERAQALEAVAAIRDEALREDATLEVALASAQRGDEASARELIDSAEDGPPRWNALGQIALGHIERGDDATALEIAGEIEDDEWRASTQAELVGVLVAKGRLEDALRLAGAIEHAYVRARALRRVADRLGPGQREEKLKLLELALNSAAADRSQWAAESNASFIAGILAEAGRVDSACEVAAAMSGLERRDDVLHTIASTLAASGTAADVESMLARFHQPSDRARILVAAAGSSVLRAQRGS